MKLQHIKPFLAFLVWLVAIPAYAAGWLPLAKASGGGGGYTGPGDVIASNVKAWWGFRCYSSTSSGNMALVADSHTATSFTMSCASGGTISATDGSGHTLTDLTTDCASGSGFTCTLTTWYDQSGANLCSSAACNLVGNGTNPTVISNNANLTGTNKFGIYYAATNNPMTTTGFPASTQPNTVFLVAKSAATVAFDQLFYIAAGGTNPIQYYINNTIGIHNDGGGQFLDSTSILTNTWYSAGLLNASGSVKVQVNNAALQSSASWPSAQTSTGEVFIYNSGTDLVGMEEAGVYTADESSQFTAYYTNAHTYWGF